jgi:hypothetical protein
MSGYTEKESAAIAQAVKSAETMGDQWHWSDWFAHAADVLAVLYEMRGRPNGKTVEEWLRDVAASEGDNSLARWIKPR